LHSLGVDPSGSRTDVTLLDAPEHVPPYPLNPGITTDNSNPIPQHYHDLDNYITAFGNLHDEAANIYLRQGLPVVAAPPITPQAIAALVQNIKDFHAYAHQWYTDSVF